jgi:hypothetical protein
MVGCTLFTLPPPCKNGVESLWWLPSLRPFHLGPFSQEPYHTTAWASPSSLFWSPDIPVDVEVYSIVLLACDLLLTLAWHFATKYVVTRRQFRIRYLSPSVRFTGGVIFGAARLYAISHLRPTALYLFLARLCFFVYLFLGLSALVFDDGPWRNVRPNAKSALNRDSILNPYATLNKALATSVSVTKLTLARPAVRRSLESGKTVSIVLDANGSLLYARRGPLEIRDAVSMRRDSRCIIELVARREVCKSGNRDFFGFIRGAPFEKLGMKGMTVAQKQSLLELLISLNDCASLIKRNAETLAFLKPDVRWFQVPNPVAKAIKDKEREEDEELSKVDGAFGTSNGKFGGVMGFYK